MGRMNIHYVVIIIAVFVMFISMGSNPFEAPPGYVPPDEFKDGIKARLSGDAGMGFSSTPFSGGGAFNGSAPMADVPVIQRDNKYNVGDEGDYSNYYNNNNVTNSAPRLRRKPFGEDTTPQNNNVPVPFQNLPNTRDGGASLYYFPGRPEIQTNDGKPLKFDGSTVYTVSQKGDQVIMPDGDYNLSDGRQIRVRAGKNMYPPNVNQFN